MFDRSSQNDDRGERREQSTGARQAAEALFSPKPQHVEPPVREAAPAGEAVRKPRVLAVAAALPVPRDESEAPASVEPPKEARHPGPHTSRASAPG